MSMHDFWSKSGVHFQTKCPLKFQNFKFCQFLYNFGRDPPRISMQEFFAVKLLCTFREDAV